MNTKIEYMYRDTSNYKQYDEVIVAGQISWEEFSRYLDVNNCFDSEQIGLPNLAKKFKDYPTEDDHCYHELIAISPTTENAEMSLSISKLIKRYK